MSFEHTLNLRVTGKHSDGVTVEFDLLPGYLNSHGVLHGGVTASIADEAAWHAIENHFGYGVKKSTTTELKVNYLRPLGGKVVTARARRNRNLHASVAGQPRKFLLKNSSVRCHASFAAAGSYRGVVSL
jgi:uncharacterized protein (TIGR00369 family)